MKIIFIIPDLGSGGAERVVSILANSFVNYDINVDIMLLQSDKVSYQISNQVNVVYFNMDLLSSPKILACKIMRDYFKQQKKHYGKIVVMPFLDTCLKRALISTAGLDIPVVASERNDPYQKGINLISRFKANIPYLLATRCVFQTPGARDFYCKFVRRKSNVIMNPLMMSEHIRWKGTKSKRIVSVGRLEPQKNQRLLIDAFCRVSERHPDYVLDIYGEGSLRDELQARINELRLENVIYLRGYSSDIHGILENSTMFVLSSDYEGMSNALIEALAAGMPVITTDHPCGGAKMLVQNNENGILVPINDENAMASAMKRIIEDDLFAYKIGNTAYKVRGLLAADQIAKEWLNMIERL